MSSTWGAFLLSVKNWAQAQQAICREHLSTNPSEIQLTMCDMQIHLAHQAFDSLSDQDPAQQDGVAIEAFQRLVKAFLDVSFADESEIVQSDFDPSKKQRLAAVLDGLDNCLLFANELCALTGKELGAILSNDEVTCIHWRKGALIYMMIKTYWGQNSASAASAGMAESARLVFTGVSELRKMLAVRSVEASPLTSDPRDLAKLINEGIFSDTHLLANVYAGELAFIGWSYGKRFAGPTESADFLGLKKDAVEFLEKYVRVAGTTLQGYGWSVSEPQAMLAKLGE